MAALTTRRRLLVGSLAVATAVLVAPRRSRAAAPIAVAVPFSALGAIVRAVGGDLVSVQVRPSLAPTAIAIGDRTVDLGDRLLLKGKGAARARYLDDARNASKLAAHVRDALAEAAPEHEPAIVARHKTWSKAFARKVLRWELALRKSPLQGKKLADPHGRVYLLEWAGAAVSPTATDQGPAALSKLPAGPSAPTPEAYATYVDALVAAVS